MTCKFSVLSSGHNCFLRHIQLTVKLLVLTCWSLLFHRIVFSRNQYWEESVFDQLSSPYRRKSSINRHSVVFLLILILNRIFLKKSVSVLTFCCCANLQKILFLLFCWVPPYNTCLHSEKGKSFVSVINRRASINFFKNNCPCYKLIILYLGQGSFISILMIRGIHAKRLIIIILG